jgi:hypothetical protein
MPFGFEGGDDEALWYTQFAAAGQDGLSRARKRPITTVE